MDLDSKLLKALRTDPAQSVDSLLKILESLPADKHTNLQNLASSIPFPNLHTAVNEFLSIRGLVLFIQPLSSSPVSHFIPEAAVKALPSESRFPDRTEQEVYERVMKELFLSIGRVPNHERIMGSYPLYLEKHFEVVKSIFLNESSISSVWRYYIAYMAAAAHKCEYLMRLTQALCCRFNQDWLPDPRDLPEKLNILRKVNSKLAHRPWEFSEKDIKELAKHWNPNELILALTILCQFHCLSGFVFGLGIAPEFDLPIHCDKEQIIPEIKTEKPKINIVAVLNNYEEIKEEEEYMSDMSEDVYGEEEDFYYSEIAGDFIGYVNYPMDTIVRPFNASDFRFADQAYYIMEKIIPDVAECIWSRIMTTFAMTYEYVGQDTGVNTGPLRRAIWNYVQRVYGLQYDDYNYTDINRFLKINTKKYIKKTACFPEMVQKQDYVNIELDLTHDEMVHLNLLICEARFEAQLVYMLHAVQRASEIS
jgi:hypothetical protein